jgi:hypothetical protein
MLAVALALVSILAYAAAASAQHRLASGPAGTSLPRMLLRGAWWAAVAVNAAGAVFHVVALKFGSLTLVQSLGALTLIAALPISARTTGRPVSRKEWRGAALTLLGLAAFLPVTAGSGEPTHSLGVPAALCVGVIAMLSVPLALATPRGNVRSLSLAAASGIHSGAASALFQTVLLAGGVLSWHSVTIGALAISLAVGGLLLSQAAYAGGLGAPLAVLTLANPVAGTVIGMTLLAEGIRGGLAGAALAAVSALVAARGVILLTRGTTVEVTRGVPAPA